MLATPGRGESPAYAQDLLALDPDGVHRLFADLGFPHYRDQLAEHGISGDVLIHLDHAALKDVGVHSVGQRLLILKTVYDLKVAQDIPIEDGHYVPPSEDLDGAGPLPAYQILGLLTERDERIHRLESEVHSLHSALLHLREEALTVARTGGTHPAPPGGGGKPRPSVRSPTGLGFAHPLSNASTLSRSSSTPSRPRNPPPVPVPTSSSSTLALPPNSATGLPDSPHSPGVDSPHLLGDGQQQQQQQQQAYYSSSPHPPYSVTTGQAQQDVNASQLQPADISISGVATPTTPTAPMLLHSDPNHGGSGAGGPSSTPHLHPASSASRSGGTGPDLAPSTGSATTSSLSPSSSSRPRDPSASPATDHNPYRSFRVTVEDPCYKVLPAALKKYKINDDWRLYALFICYGNTERCLAYDEKPLLLFQKLKESNDNPVFMLRHIKDIKSPIAVATAKHAARRDKRPAGIGGGVERSLMGVNRDGTANPAAGANGLAPNARPTRLHHPPVLLPVGKDAKGEDAAGGGGESAATPSGEGAAADRKDEAGKKAQGYCIAIYPYLAEREDEFDVAVGDTFVILSKTKGWWVVHRDGAPASLSSSTSSNPDHSAAPRKSAWVPAGCLLETLVPPLSLLGSSSASSASSSVPAASAAGLSSATDPSTSPTSASNSKPPATSSSSASAGVPAHEGNAASVPIPPALVVSVSTPGIALMDYVPRGAGELEVRKGAPLRILKRYNHWSYAVKEDGGRGWLPSWFCGRVSSNSSNNSSSGGAAAGTGRSTEGAATGSTSAGAAAAGIPTTPVATESGQAGTVPTTTASTATTATAAATAAGLTRPATAPSEAAAAATAPKPPLTVRVPPALGPGSGTSGGGARSAGPPAMMIEPTAASASPAPALSLLPGPSSAPPPAAAATEPTVEGDSLRTAAEGPLAQDGSE